MYIYKFSVLPSPFKMCDEASHSICKDHRWIQGALKLPIPDSECYK